MNCHISAIGTVSKLANQTKSLFINNKVLLDTINTDEKIAVQRLTK
jgi:hypothetical protein